MARIGSFWPVRAGPYDRHLVGAQVRSCRFSEAAAAPDAQVALRPCRQGARVTRSFNATVSPMASAAASAALA